MLTPHLRCLLPEQNRSLGYVCLSKTGGVGGVHLSVAGPSNSLLFSHGVGKAVEMTPSQLHMERAGKKARFIYSFFIILLLSSLI